MNNELRGRRPKRKGARDWGYRLALPFPFEHLRCRLNYERCLFLTLVLGEKIFLIDLYMLFVESMLTLVGYFLKKFLFFLRD